MRMLLRSVACHSFKLLQASLGLQGPRGLRNYCYIVSLLCIKITISVEDFTDREKSYREILLLRSYRKRLLLLYKGNVAGVEEDVSLGV
jgi:hypothetical protein